MAKEITKELVLENLVTFCGNDNEGAQELFEIIQKVISDSLPDLEKYNKADAFDEFRRVVHKLRFSLSAAGLSELLAVATHIDETMTAINASEASYCESRNSFVKQLHAMYEIIR
ncbi:MAG: hypothetical protein ACKOXB_02520 [Flavobacteriales bacterium]